MHQRAEDIARRLREARAGGRTIRKGGRTAGACALRRGAPMKLAIPVRSAVERMRPYHPPLGGRGGKLRLDFNENTIGCSPAVRKALRKLSSADVSIYPEQETVRRELARYFRVHPDELLLTNGTDEALHLIVDTFLPPADSLLLVEPTFPLSRFYPHPAL